MKTPVAIHSASEKRVLVKAAVCAVLICAADQLTKWWIVNSFQLYESLPVIPRCFSITSVRNLGAAWSILSGHTWLLLAVGIIAFAAVIRYFRALTEGWTERYYALAAVLAGIAGNSIDRCFRGAVVDFLDVHWSGVWQYPVFNVADVAICCGIGVYILSSLLRPAKEEKSDGDGKSC